MKKIGRADVLASLVVFLVALPLCLGIAVASGAPPELGVISGAIGGIFVGLFGGSPLQVSGPANGLIVIIYDLIREQGLAALGLAVFVAGSMQFLAGVLKLGQFFRAISPGVIHGLMLSFAVIIASSQVHVIMDLTAPGSALQNIAAFPAALWSVVTGGGMPSALLVGLGTLLTIWGWRRFAPGPLKTIPASLVGVVAMTAMAYGLSLPVVRLELPASILGSLSLTNPLAVTWSWGLIEVAAVIAFIASAETLLSATAVDQLHSGARTKYSKELAAQGLGNMLCGLVGALPITGVIIRSSANIAAGATTKASTVLHGVWLLAFVIFAGSLAEMVPMACLAAILIDAVIKLVNPKAVTEMYRFDPFNVVVYAGTALGVVLLGVLPGVLLGLGLSVVRLVQTLIQLKVHKHETGEGRFEVELAGAATFLSLPRLAAVLESLPPGTHVSLRTGGLQYVDQACHQLIQSWKKQHSKTGGTTRIPWSRLPTRPAPVQAGEAKTPVGQTALTAAPTPPSP